MALQYLLSPSFQVEGISGKPLVGGWIEVFLHDNYTEAGKVITKKDFDGTDNPFKIPLNVYGMATIIVDDSNVYDVFCYNIFGSLVWSRTNVSVNVGGGAGSGLTAILPLVIREGVISNNGSEVNASGQYAWAEGLNTTASGTKSHAEGHGCVASGDNSHAEGYGTKATKHHSHAEGFETEADGQYSHAEGSGTETRGYSSHAEGDDTLASGQASHAEGYNTLASGNNSHAGGEGTRATGDNSTAIGKYNDDGTALFVVGNGTGGSARSDCFKVDSNGETWVKIRGVLKRAGDADEVDIAPEWSASDVSDYDVGTLVYHDGTLYRCKVSNPSATWVDAEWEQADIAEEIDALKQIRWNGLTPLTSTSNNFRINASGSVESANGYVLNRYYVAGLGGRTIRISADYNSVFSTTDSASGKVTLGLSAGEYIVPLTANYLIVSHTQGSPFDVSIADFEASPSNSRSKVHLTYYDSSSGYKIDASGNAVADANYKLVRYHTDTLANRIVEIETSGYSVFSTSSSASNRVTDALEAGDYVVPYNGSYLIISVPNDEEFNVWLITDEPTIGKYGTYGLQMRWSENTTYRLRDSINKSFSIDNATGLITSDFDTCYPWCDMRLCNIENPAGLRTITYQGDAGFTFSKDTYVEIPKFYFKRVFDPNTEYEYWYISSKGGDGFDLEPWFRNADGSEAPVRYVARYNLATSGNISRTGYPAYWNVSKADLKTYCESNDVKLMDINAYQALIHLFVIESGTKDSQSFFKGVSYFRYFTEQTNQQMTNASATTNTIEIPTTDGRNEYFGVGDRVAIFQTASNDFNEAIIRNLTAVSYGGGTATLTFDGAAISLTHGVSRIYGINQLNGRTDGVSATSGRTTDGDEHTRSFTYRGIENLWGNLGELVDGITYDYDNHRFKIGNEYVTFETPINRSYIEDTSIPKWIKYFGVDARFPSFTLPCAPLTQSVSTSYTDEWSTFGNESGISDISYGCAWDHQNANGVMCFRNVRDVGNILYTGRAML